MIGQMMQMPLTVGSLIEHAARFHTNTPIVSVETAGGIDRSSWGAIGLNARRLASALRQLGVNNGDRCATIAWNNRRHLEIYFGVAGEGMVCHTINPRLSSEQLIFVANDAQDQVLFLDQTFLPAVVKLRPHLSSVKHFIVMGPRDDEAAQMLDGVLFYDELIATGNPDHPFTHVDENTASSLCYTSGTTGDPKGVLYSHRSTLLHTLAGNQPDGIAIAAKDTVLPVVPMFHVNAWGVPYIAAAVGCKLVLPGPGMDGDSLVKLIDSEAVTLSLGVPTIWLGLLAALKNSGSKAASLQRTIVGGSALPPSMIATFRDEYDVELIHAWGMTETSPLGTLNQLLQHHSDLTADEKATIRNGQGRPLFGVDLRLINEAGDILPHDGKTQGDLQIKGHWIVERYFGMPSDTVTSDGWFDTGDVASIDTDGYLIIRDRSKDIIKSGGEWISTVTLENILVSHPDITNAAAIAARHEKWDERPVVLAVQRDGATTTEEALLAFYDGKVPKWQVPDKIVFIDELPIGGTGKVQKNKLREVYGDILITE